MDHVFEAAGLDPSLCLLVHGLPGWEVIGQQSPGRTGSHDPAKRVEDVAQVMFSLRRFQAH